MVFTTPVRGASSRSTPASEPELVHTLVTLHSRLWRRGERWDGARPTRGVEVDLTDVLAELLAGATDESASHRLNVSLRTYRRRVQDLLHLLGTSSRFEAGAIAQERGYLDLVRPENHEDWREEGYLAELEAVLAAEAPSKAISQS